MFLGVLLVNNGAIIIAFDFSKAAVPRDILGAKWIPTFFFFLFENLRKRNKMEDCIYNISGFSQKYCFISGFSQKY